MPDRLALPLPDWAQGVLVVGDVHGQAALFQAMVRLAERQQLFLVSLGDLVDRGPDNPGALRLMLRLLGAGRGLFIRGNHDDKLYRTLKGNPTVIDGDLAVTLEQLEAAADGKALLRDFSVAYRAAPYVVQIGQTVLVHGALAPAMLTAKSLPRKLKALAIYGEAAPDPVKKTPIRTYRWLQAIPAGITVVIGHHPISDATILERRNEQGGRLIHLDCGAGKGRGLGALRLDTRGRVETAFRTVPGATGAHLLPAPLADWRTVADETEIG